MKPWVEHETMSFTNIIERNECSGWPSTSKNKENIQKVWNVICSSHHLTIHELEEEGGISKTTYHEILTENLGMHYVAAISVPLMLSEDKKQIVLMSVKSLSTVQIVMKTL